MIRRHRYLIIWQLQKKYLGRVILTAMAIGGFTTLIVSAVGVIEISHLTSVSATEKYTLLIDQGGMILFFLVSSFFSSLLILALWTLRLTHRIAGPLYALSQQMKAAANGDWNGRLHLRRTDQLQDLKDAFNHALESLCTQWQSERSALLSILRDLEEALVLARKELSFAESEKIENLTEKTRELMRAFG